MKAELQDPLLLFAGLHVMLWRDPGQDAWPLELRIRTRGAAVGHGLVRPHGFRLETLEVHSHNPIQREFTVETARLVGDAFNESRPYTLDRLTGGSQLD